MIRLASFAGACLLLSALVACSRPSLPEQDAPPEPQAAAPSSSPVSDAIQRPIDKAKQAEVELQKAADAQRAAIDAATSGG